MNEDQAIRMQCLQLVNDSALSAREVVTAAQVMYNFVINKEITKEKDGDE